MKFFLSSLSSKSISNSFVSFSLLNTLLRIASNKGSSENKSIQFFSF